MNLLKQIRKCTECKEALPNPPKPILNFSSDSKIIIIGQAPGIKAHDSGIPWNDPSGKRLRDWLQVDENTFYNSKKFGILPMGFCYPGKGKTGDLPPRPECAELWMGQVLTSLKSKKLILLIGQYAQKYFLGEEVKETLTETVASWRDYQPLYFTLPHPSPRNNIWMKKNPWFDREVIPELRKQVTLTLN